MRNLEQELREYGESDLYPFHMPGHKRQLKNESNPYEIDITEVDGWDNLHQKSGILLDSALQMAQVFHTKESFYLINGSTCGILSAISAAVPRGGSILLARNSHKSAYHGIFLRQLKAYYAYPQITSYGIQGSIFATDIEKELQKHADISAVFITSPTYDGVVSNIAEIAETVHRYGKILIVDEAHGAHFGFHPYFPESATSNGGDLVIQSLHKTLPAYTQTAVLHRCSERISSQNIQKYLGIYETSSPSYVLMAGIDRCVRMLHDQGPELFSTFSRRLTAFYKNVSQLKYLQVLSRNLLTGHEAYQLDPSKILISTIHSNCHGPELYHWLLEKYHLQMEMCSGEYVTAITTIMDTEEGFLRLEKALLEIDADCGPASVNKRTYFIQQLYQPMEQVMNIAEAEEAAFNYGNLQGKDTNINANKRNKYVDNSFKTNDFCEQDGFKSENQDVTVKAGQEGCTDGYEIMTDDRESAVGKISGEYIYLYPPGIPVIVPGERITKQLQENLHHCHSLGLEIHGPERKNENLIKIVK